MTKKTVLITGCSSGFGLATAKLLLAHHWRVIATARSPKTSAELSSLHHPALTVLTLDVTNREHRTAIQNYIADHLDGKLHCLINNAGFGLLGPFEELTDEQIREQLEVNVFGTIFLTKLCLPFLRKTQGRILNVSSLLGYLGFPLHSLYVTSKFAIEGFSETLHHELAPHGVQVTILQPGAHNTRFGTNVIAPPAKTQLDIYQTQKNNIEHFRKKLADSNSGGTAETFAQVVLALLNKRKMPLRKRVGTDSNIVYLLKRIIPANLFETLVGYYYKRMHTNASSKSD